MEHLMGAAAGLAWGAVIGLVKHLVCWSGKEKANFSRQAYTYMAVGGALNVGALLAVYFLRHWLPFPFETTLVGTAVGLALCSQLLSLKKARQGTKAAPPAGTGPEPSEAGVE